MIFLQISFNLRHAVPNNLLSRQHRMFRLLIGVSRFVGFQRFKKCICIAVILLNQLLFWQKQNKCSLTWILNQINISTTIIKSIKYIITIYYITLQEGTSLFLSTRQQPLSHHDLIFMILINSGTNTGNRCAFFTG